MKESPAFVETEDVLVFAAPERDRPVLDILVNFGLFAGREATAAELEVLGRGLLEKVDHVSIVAERRHEIGAAAEIAVHQVRVEVPADAVPLWGRDLAELRGRLIEVTEQWALACLAERREEVSEG